MSDLKSNLAKLETTVPALAERITAVVHAAEALEQTANAMMQQYQAKEHEIGELAEQVKQALVDLQGEGTDAEGLVRNKADDAEHAAEAALGAIRSARDELSSAVESTGEAYDGLREHLTTAEGRVRAAHDEAHQSFGQLESGVEDGGSQLGTGNTAMTEAVAGAGHAYEQGSSSVAQGAEALRQKMSELLEGAQHRIDASHSAIHEHSSSLESGVGEALSDLAERKDTLYQELTARVESELKQRLDAAVEGVVEALGMLSQTVSATKDAVEAQREAVAGEFSELADRHPPLNAGVESVKQAAEQVEVSY